jgi:hypothetical protein
VEVKGINAKWPCQMDIGQNNRKALKTRTIRVKNIDEIVQPLFVIIYIYITFCTYFKENFTKI